MEALPFKGYKVRAFADLLAKVEGHSRVEGAKRPAAGGGKKPDAAAVEEACQRALHLYDRAIDPNVTLDEIEAAVQALRDLDPPKGKLDAVAQRMGYAQKFKSKADVLKAIRQKILGRKGAFDRVNA